MKKSNNTFDIVNTRHVIKKAVLLLRPVKSTTATATSRNQSIDMAIIM